MVLWDQTSFAGLVLACRVIGVLAVEQNGQQQTATRERNDRGQAVPIGAPRDEALRDVTDVPDRLRE
jgi:inorganic pyrophosphatase